MTLQYKVLGTVLILLSLWGYYTYQERTIDTQKQTIKTLKVEKHTITQNTKTKVAQANLYNLKENYETDKNDSTIINESIGIHRLQLED